ncbi:MAG: hypothetical protein FJX28_08390 [Alphaproteobacteria bacterium]|nr:hypothetical protein [Alphaproteobacteria bacterium]
MARAGLLAIAALWLGTMQAVAGDGIATEGKLSDKDFFRLATCGATPGGDCLGPVVRWSKAEVTVSLAPAHRRCPPKLAKAMSEALDRAISETNRAGAGIRLLRDDRLSAPDIIVSRPALSEGERTRNIPRMPNGHEIGVGFMWLWWDEQAEITEASMLIAEDITIEDLPSVMLEELFQCLGFLYDIENRYYEGRLILSQDSNATTRLAGQDRMIPRRLYP